jgi:EpsI family protein
VASNLRFAAAALLLLGAAIFLHARHRSDVVASHRQFLSFPQRVGEWAGRDESISQDILETLGPGDFLARIYHADSDSAAQQPVSLFVAYFPNQRFGSTFHSPKNCLPGAGWSAVESGTVKISLPGQEPFLANRYLIAKGAERGLVFYWYQAHERSTASEYWAKLYLVEDSIRFDRSDGALIRFTTQVAQQESEADAERRLMDFLRGIVPILGPYLRG